MTGSEVRLAATAEAGTVLDLLDDAARWLTERGIALWSPGQWRHASILEAIERGETFIAFDGARAVGTLSLQWRDPIFWPDAAEDAGYVHRVAVAREAHGRAVGRQLLAFAERTARRSGTRFLRLDCACESAALRAYYAAAGFTWRGDRTIAGTAGPWCAALFEKAL
ncbi:MAG: GNAT family N-acetyltransferase [Candidatus Limnocylindria bacterium]